MGASFSSHGDNPLDPEHHRSYLLLFPAAGMVIFVFLYIIAAFNYPGGSYAMPQNDSFSFWHNYLCDLLDAKAINGEPNTARLYARWALGILCASLVWLWWHLHRLFNRRSPNLYLMRFAGLLALGTMVFLGADTHDLIVRIAGVFGVVALLSCLVELYKGGYTSLVILGLASLLVFLLNYYIYETGTLLFRLPVIQKLTFFLFLLWFGLLNLALFKKIKMEEE